MRASNILGLTERPFDRDTFHLSCPIQSFPDGRQSFAIDHQNVVRFRWIPGDDGEMAPQTNSRCEAQVTSRPEQQSRNTHRQRPPDQVPVEPWKQWQNGAPDQVKVSLIGQAIAA